MKQVFHSKVPPHSERFHRLLAYLKELTISGAVHKLTGEDRVAAQLVNILVGFSLPLIAIDIGAMLWAGLWVLVSLYATFLLSLFVVLFLNYLGFFRASKIALLLAGNFFVFCLVVILPKDTYVAWCFLMILFATEQLFANEHDGRHRLSLYGPLLPVALFFLQDQMSFLSWKIEISDRYVAIIRSLVWFGSAFIFYAQTRLWSNQKEESKRLIAATTSFNTSLINNLPIGIYSSDPSGIGTTANRFLMRLTGLPDEATTATHWIESLHPGDALSFKREFAELITGQRTIVQRPLRLKRSDGRFVWVQNTTVPFYDHENKAIGFIGSLLDMTEQIKAQQDLRLAMQAIDAVAIVAETDERGKILRVNDNFCKISGYEREELMGQDHRVINSGYHPPEFFRDLWSTIRADLIWTGEIQNRRKNGETYWVHTVVVPLSDELSASRRYLALRFDISAQKEIQKKMIESSKMSSLGEMAGGIAHEINNPLAVIHGKSAQLKKALLHPDIDIEKVRSGLEIIEATTLRISKIVKGLRSFSRNSERDPMEPVLISTVISETLELCLERFKHHGVEIQVHGDTALTVQGRPAALSQVLMNLLSNALDAVQLCSEKWVHIEARSEARSELILAVMDSGPGIPDAVAARMMQPFFTTKDINKGTGLGLSISLGIVSEHQGTLTYDASSPHTRFVIRLPLLTDPPSASHI